ncbi:hypothetical protein [Roseibium sp. RKSG952]|uniref:hypothetical protein n=1 Tax=Roseibium sp. RKSG952 TaxID=2529384 RepID=UPI0012BD0C2F|nr:hypothetical protein [Roseibium sp. RKSG952]MTI03767.1 hypothetical protein [Roseibium sp. RKSG952]
MVQNNKVLTVSYGTFSCTLEGFDDSFETMKAIAEYFRDLAADDRYFGSEPPQPDAEMLTRIAQRDASRRVEASQNETGLLLRATEEAPAAEPQPVAPVIAAEQPQPQPQQTPDSTPDLTVVDTAPSTGADAFFAEAEPVEPAQPAAADSIAAKLQRIRAVVSHADEGSTAYSEDEDNGYLTPAQPKVDAISAAFESGALSPEDLDDTATGEAPQAAPEAPEPVIEPEATPEIEETIAEAEVQEELAEADQPTDVLFSDLDEAPEAEEEQDEIVNILDVDESDEDDVTENDENSTLQLEQSDIVFESHDGILTAEDEHNLLNEISEVEAEMDARTGHKLSEESGIDQDVSRLMDKADARMDDPATNDQRETYSHLRTAVAATEAERDEAGEDAAAAGDADYRGDLASVVSPRRPAEIEVTSLRPETDNAAPLKLVAEQRIDTQDTDAGPITPRRVTAAQEDEDTSEEGGFASFAQEQGAQSLPDLLEAAAAYLSFIEGQEQFSRPQLMNKVRSLKQDEFNREESLRSFGQLLRDGKIEKAGGGRFAASNQIGFRPDDKRAAG